MAATEAAMASSSLSLETDPAPVLESAGTAAATAAVSPATAAGATAEAPAETAAATASAEAATETATAEAAAEPAAPKAEVEAEAAASAEAATETGAASAEVANETAAVSAEAATETEAAAETEAATAVTEAAAEAQPATEAAAETEAPTGSEAGDAKSAMANKLLSLNGVFAVHKPKGPTSAELLNRLKEKLLAEAGMPLPKCNKRKKQTFKIGHGGTLDSAAKGVLVVGVGRGTKMLTSMLSGTKRYIATGELGKATDTLDSTGKVTEEKPYDKITQEDIEGILQKFTGNIMQVPPLYSALKKDGQRLSTLMKRGEAVEAKPARPVTVYSISLQKFQPPFFTLDVECGGGFYIRSLVSDIGKELSSCANVLELTRTKQGPFTLEDHALPEEKWTIDDIAQALELCSSLLPEETGLKKPKPEESKEEKEEPKEQAVSCECVSLNEVKGEDDVIQTC
ncbi:pseudouridylate synthase TRUB1 isoform X1 [Trichechus manatus latirostris]|uniref:Pseudouridylate synthase TRUB1 n=1 Tax=Trichechus manatus latirostris TaxID=127582 RepID=A0A2Y9QUH4_TRIMA|nr:pseudouridylate synthase TRUB1 isoform X1 [Trichechus manatus latirostris]